MPDVKGLLERGNTLFSGRTTLLSHWQDIAENFYPQRADFTINRTLGEEFADHLYSSYPILVHRELSSSIAAMLRKRDTEWFRVTVEDDDDLSLAGKQWLEEATKRMRRAMYDRRTQFVRATTEGDADFSAFGQCCISREIDWNKPRPHLLYRTWHLRDVAWAESYDGSIQEIHINWKPRIEELKNLFSDKIHGSLQRKTDTEAMTRVPCRRVVIKNDIYHGEMPGRPQQPWTMVFIDVQNEHIMGSTPLWTPGFVLPRWQTVSGSQYAYSPATVAGLPDARLLQSMTLTLLEAGEMAVHPPLVATQDAIREDVQWYAGGITWADTEYDERKGDVLRPINQDRSALPWGYEAAGDQRGMLAAAFYLNKLTLPPAEGDMTATEVRERIQEYIRQALPLFEPMESQYNYELCDDTFSELMRVGTFGAQQEIPTELQGRNTVFQFQSPLHDAIEREDASKFLESKQLIMEAIELDPDALATVDVRTALNDALNGIASPAKWRRDEREQAELIEAKERAEQAMLATEVAEQAANAAEAAGKAEQANAA